MKRVNHRYGWVKDNRDNRDVVLRTPRVEDKKLPEKVDIRDKCPKITDQGKLGSCVAHGVATAISVNLKTNGFEGFNPSKLFLYYNGRILEGTVEIDAGMQIRNCVKGANRFGVCDENLWPYLEEKFNVFPNKVSFETAKKNRPFVYNRVIQEGQSIKEFLAHNIPIVCGMVVYDTLESGEASKTGVVHLPEPKEKSLGGHCIVLVGYDDTTKFFICRNSWGESWGDNGYFYLPYDYVLNPRLAMDFWSVRVINSDKNMF